MTLKLELKPETEKKILKLCAFEVILMTDIVESLLEKALLRERNAATLAVPAQTQAEKKGLPPKGMMTEESTAKVTPINEVMDKKKVFPKRSNMQPMEVGPITVDSVVKH